MSARAAVDALVKTLSESGCERAQDALIDVIRQLGSPLDEAETRRALDELRGKRCFALMAFLCGSVVGLASEHFSIYVRRQWVQAIIELGDYEIAKAKLEDLMKDLAGQQNAEELSEVLGLFGRVFKSLFVENPERGEDHLRTSIRYYAKGFPLDPAWHGANLVALVARAERDKIRVDTSTANEWASALLKELERKPPMRWTPWDSASAAEAYLAMGEWDKVASSFASYWNAPNISPFALAGTERQLREIWQIESNSKDSFLASLLVHFRARQLAAPGGGVKCTAAELCQLAARLESATGDAEAVFGAGSALPLGRMLGLLENARSVCRVADPYNPKRGGTGFLIDGGKLSRRLDDGKMFIVTNHHVLHGKEASAEELQHADYQGAVDVERAEAQFHYWNGEPVPKSIKLKGVVRHSPRNQLDFTVASLEEELPASLGLALSDNPKPLGSRNFVDPQQRAKVFVVGHPQGEALSFSVSDNEVVDHELDDEPPADRPRRIHYRVPTEPGSSGSPVFHHETLKVVGVHRSGSAAPLREDWPRKKADEEYEANEAMSVRSIRDYLDAT